jgi:haloacetate dehalogenase
MGRENRGRPASTQPGGVLEERRLAQKVRVPMLVLWGMRSGQGSGYDVLKVWRDHADDVRGLGIHSGHFIPEEQPDGMYAALKEFFNV